MDEALSVSDPAFSNHMGRIYEGGTRAVHLLTHLTG